ncbi:MAG: hypothetical protein JO157_06020 [Acetobacteraceae bacterium]|nr:hypothetical protein [Acetobacteraceae bacterium]
MARLALALAVLAAAGAFGAIGLALALVGLGVPYLAATAGAALIAGVAAYLVLHALVVRPLASVGTEAPGALGRDVARQRARLAALEAATSSLRHDLRGMLSPALLVSDRLLAHSDPKVVRAGETIVRAITRATERLAATRPPAPGAASAQEAQPGAPAAAHQDHGVLPEHAAERLDPARGC